MRAKDEGAAAADNQTGNKRAVLNGSAVEVLPTKKKEVNS